MSVKHLQYGFLFDFLKFFKIKFQTQPEMVSSLQQRLPNQSPYGPISAQNNAPTLSATNTNPASSIKTAQKPTVSAAI